MNKQEAIDYFGGVKKLAEALDVWPQSIYQWNDQVPELSARKLHDLTDGKLVFRKEDYQTQN